MIRLSAGFASFVSRHNFEAIRVTTDTPLCVNYNSAGCDYSIRDGGREFNLFCVRQGVVAFGPCNSLCEFSKRKLSDGSFAIPIDESCVAEHDTTSFICITERDRVSGGPILVRRFPPVLGVCAVVIGAFVLGSVI